MPKTLLFSVTMQDCQVETFRCGGAGGQNVNKRSTGVRIRHLPSGAVGESREHRTQHQNKKAAFQRMAQTPAMQGWIRFEAARRAGEPSIEQRVLAQMAPTLIRCEIQQDGKWTLENGENPEQTA